MGNRANVAFTPDPGQAGTVCLYTHWDGARLPLLVKQALAKRWRWDDKSYLTRIVFCHIVGESYGDETGFGIDVSPPDNQHLFIVIDVMAQEVRFVTEWPVELNKVLARWSFEEYITTSDEVIIKAYTGGD